jgi:16S rRNA processing protein RimM
VTHEYQDEEWERQNGGAGSPALIRMQMEDQGEFVAVAKVTKTQGRKGEVAAALLTDFPERFAERKRLFALDEKDRRREMQLEDHWFHKGGVVLKFAGVDSISQAEELIGCEIQIPASERAELEDDSVYISDLVGCTVSDSGREIGRIERVQFGSGEAPLLVVKGKGGKEYLVPFATAYLDKIDLKGKQVRMRLPAGLLELD